MLKEIYLDTHTWRADVAATKGIKHLGQIFPEKNLELSGLISRGARTRSVYYQMWFSEHHPDVCSIGPTERWLEHAAFLLSLDFTIEGPFYSATSGYLLREYATHAVRDYILDEICIMFGWDIKIFVLPILDAILGISKTREEGAWPRGKLVFISPDDFARVDFLVRFPISERPSLQKHKHVRKLLQAVDIFRPKTDFLWKSCGGNRRGAKCRNEGPLRIFKEISVSSDFRAFPFAAFQMERSIHPPENPTW